MIIGTLGKAWRYCYHKEDFKIEAVNLCRRLINRGHNPDKMKKIFDEVLKKIERREKLRECRLMKNPTSHQVESKQKEKLFLYYAACHPKDTSRKMIEEFYNATCARKFRDLLGIDRLMIACHKTDSIRKALMPSRLRDCKEDKRNTKCHAINNNTTRT